MGVVPNVGRANWGCVKCVCVHTLCVGSGEVVCVKNSHLEAREDGLVKCSLCKHEAQSLDPGIHMTSWASCK